MAPCFSPSDEVDVKLGISIDGYDPIATCLRIGTRNGKGTVPKLEETSFLRSSGRPSCAPRMKMSRLAWIKTVGRATSPLTDFVKWEANGNWTDVSAPAPVGVGWKMSATRSSQIGD